MPDPCPALAVVPTLDALAGDPALADGLPAATLAALLERFEIGAARLRSRLLLLGAESHHAPASAATASVDDWITLGVAAAIVHRSPVWLRRQRLPFMRRVSRKCVLISKSKLLRWIETRGAS
jgi:hypothetical protein